MEVGYSVEANMCCVFEPYFPFPDDFLVCDDVFRAFIVFGYQYHTNHRVNSVGSTIQSGIVSGSRNAIGTYHRSIKNRTTSKK